MAGDPRLRFSDEIQAIEALAAMLAPPGPEAGVEVGIGDDAAAVRFPPGAVLLAADPAIAGVHLDLSLGNLSDLGWKAVVRNVSDIAAMGGNCLHALCCVIAPRGTDLGLLYSGVTEAASAYSVAVVGGDLAAGSQLVVAAAMTGSAPFGVVERSGARPGDVLFATGAFGASAAGLRLLRQGEAAGELGEAHLRPRARLAEGQAAAKAGASAMIDVSDGFSLDLHRLLRASGVGAELEALPVARGATEDEALGGGEDYELVFAIADPDRACEVFAEQGLAAPLRLGRIVGEAGARLDGRSLAPSGWRHVMG